MREFLRAFLIVFVSCLVWFFMIMLCLSACGRGPAPCYPRFTGQEERSPGSKVCEVRR